MKTIDEFCTYCMGRYYTTRDWLYRAWGITHYAHHEQLKLCIARSISYCDKLIKKANTPSRTSGYTINKEKYELERVILIELWNYLMEKK